MLKLLKLPHKVCGLTCMINGLEDLYEQKTGNRLPDWLLFYLSGMVGFVYIKNKNAPTSRMVFWGLQIAKYQYEELADLVGFRWQMVANHSFSYTLRGVKQAINEGSAALLGALDMYHLPYYDRFYHQIHVPIHHVLMVGYDEEQEVVLVQDCDRAEVQAVPYGDLEAAWNVNVPGLGQRNTFYYFAFDGDVANIETIVRRGLQKRAAAMLESPVSILGIKGMKKLARDLPAWTEELSPQHVEASLRHLAEFTGFPPVPPVRLTGYDAPDNHRGGRDNFARLLRQLAQSYGGPAWSEAGDWFDRSGQELEQLTNSVVDYLLGECTSLNRASASVAKIASLEEQAFHLLC